MKMISLHVGFVIASIFCCSPLHTQNTSNQGLKFEQLGTILPTPNGYRGMDGAPGPKYWQQRVN